MRKCPCSGHLCLCRAHGEIHDKHPNVLLLPGAHEVKGAGSGRGIGGQKLLKPFRMDMGSLHGKVTRIGPAGTLMYERAYWVQLVGSYEVTLVVE